MSSPWYIERDFNGDYTISLSRGGVTSEIAVGISHAEVQQLINELLLAKHTAMLRAHSRAKQEPNGLGSQQDAN